MSAGLMLFPFEKLRACAYVAYTLTYFVRLAVKLAVRASYQLPAVANCTGTSPNCGYWLYSGRLRRLAEQRVTVRRHGDKPIDGITDARPLVSQQIRHQLEGLEQLRVEVILGERHLGRRQHRFLDGRDVVGTDDDRPVRVRADLHVAAVLALVHVGVHVPDDRVADLPHGAFEQRDGPDADHLVHDRGERDPGARHPRDARAPYAAADRARAGLDVALGGTDPGNCAAVGVDAQHLGAGQHPQRARLLRLLAHQGPGPQRVHHAHGGEVRPAEDDGFVQVGHELADLRRDEQLRGDTPCPRRRAPPAQFVHPLLGARDLDAAALGEHAERLVLLGAVAGQFHHHLRVLDREDEVGRMAGRAAGVGHRALAHQDEIAPAEPHQVIREAVADDARADDDSAGTVLTNHGT